MKDTEYNTKARNLFLHLEQLHRTGQEIGEREYQEIHKMATTPFEKPQTAIEVIKERILLLLADADQYAAAQISALTAGYDAGLRVPNAKCPWSDTEQLGWEWEFGRVQGASVRNVTDSDSVLSFEKPKDVETPGVDLTVGKPFQV